MAWNGSLAFNMSPQSEPRPVHIDTSVGVDQSMVPTLIQGKVTDITFANLYQYIWIQMRER